MPSLDALHLWDKCKSTMPYLYCTKKLCHFILVRVFLDLVIDCVFFFAQLRLTAVTQCQMTIFLMTLVSFKTSILQSDPPTLICLF